MIGLPADARDEDSINTKESPTFGGYRTERRRYEKIVRKAFWRLDPPIRKRRDCRLQLASGNASGNDIVRLPFWQIDPGKDNTRCCGAPDPWRQTIAAFRRGVGGRPGS
jgi:hypothetical protein